MVGVMGMTKEIKQNQSETMKGYNNIRLESFINLSEVERFFKVVKSKGVLSNYIELTIIGEKRFSEWVSSEDTIEILLGKLEKLFKRAEKRKILKEFKAICWASRDKYLSRNDGLSRKFIILDLDKKDDYKEITSILKETWGDPWILINSGTGEHWYYILEKEWGHYNTLFKEFYKLTNSSLDPSSFRVAQVFRLPGTLNPKNNQFSKILQVNKSSRPVSLEQFKELLNKLRESSKIKNVAEFLSKNNKKEHTKKTENKNTTSSSTPHLDSFSNRMYKIDEEYAKFLKVFDLLEELLKEVESNDNLKDASFCFKEARKILKNRLQNLLGEEVDPSHDILEEIAQKSTKLNDKERELVWMTITKGSYPNWFVVKNWDYLLTIDIKYYEDLRNILIFVLDVNESKEDFLSRARALLMDIKEIYLNKKLVINKFLSLDGKFTQRYCLANVLGGDFEEVWQEVLKKEKEQRSVWARIIKLLDEKDPSLKYQLITKFLNWLGARNRSRYYSLFSFWLPDGKNEGATLYLVGKKENFYVTDYHLGKSVDPITYFYSWVTTPKFKDKFRLFYLARFYIQRTKNPQEEITFEELQEKMKEIIEVTRDKSLEEEYYKIKPELCLHFEVAYQFVTTFGIVFNNTEMLSAKEFKKLRNEIFGQEPILNITIEKYILEKHWEEIFSKLKDKKMIVVDSPTGSGKTTSLIEYLKKKNEKFIFLTPYYLLTRQIEKERNIVGFYEGSQNELTPETKWIVSTWNQFWKLLKKINPEEFILVLDEAHNLYTAYDYRLKDIKTIIENLTGFKRVIMLSGTTKGLFKKVVRIKQKVKKKDKFIIYPYMAYEVIKTIRDGKKIKEDIKLRKSVVDKIKEEIEKGHKVLIYLDNKQRAEKIKEILESDGYSVNIVSSETKLKEDNQSIFNEGKLEEQITINTAVLSEGVSIYNQDIDKVFIFEVSNLYSLLQFLARFRKKKVTFYYYTKPLNRVDLLEFYPYLDFEFEEIVNFNNRIITFEEFLSKLEEIKNTIDEKGLNQKFFPIIDKMIFKDLFVTNLYVKKVLNKILYNPFLLRKVINLFYSQYSVMIVNIPIYWNDFKVHGKKNKELGSITLSKDIKRAKLKVSDVVTLLKTAKESFRVRILEKEEKDEREIKIWKIIKKVTIENYEGEVAKKIEEINELFLEISKRSEKKGETKIKLDDLIALFLLVTKKSKETLHLLFNPDFEVLNPLEITQTEKWKLVMEDWEKRIFESLEKVKKEDVTQELNKDLKTLQDGDNMKTEKLNIYKEEPLDVSIMELEWYRYKVGKLKGYHYKEEPLDVNVMKLELKMMTLNHNI